MRTEAIWLQISTHSKKKWIWLKNKIKRSIIINWVFGKLVSVGEETHRQWISKATRNQRRKKLLSHGHWTTSASNPTASPRVSTREGIRVLATDPAPPRQYWTLGILKGYSFQISAANLVVIWSDGTLVIPNTLPPGTLKWPNKARARHTEPPRV